MRLKFTRRGPKSGLRDERSDIILSNVTLDGYMRGLRADILDLDEGESIAIKKEEI